MKHFHVDFDAVYTLSSLATSCRCGTPIHLAVAATLNPCGMTRCEYRICSASPDMITTSCWRQLVMAHAPHTIRPDGEDVYATSD